MEYESLRSPRIFFLRTGLSAMPERIIFGFGSITTKKRNAEIINNNELLRTLRRYVNRQLFELRSSFSVMIFFSLLHYDE